MVSGSLVYLSLGSNIGDRRRWLGEAIALLNDEAGTVGLVSSIYETEAWGVSGQAPYLNQVVLLTTILDPDALLRVISNIEARLGRRRTVRWGSRTIDIDILYYDDLVLETETLTIPHPQLHHRNFVLYPLSEIAPGFMHPVLGLSSQALLQRSTDKAGVKKQ